MGNIFELLGEIPEALNTLKDIIFNFFTAYYNIINLLPAPFNMILMTVSSAFIVILVFKLGTKIVEVVTP